MDGSIDKIGKPQHHEADIDETHQESDKNYVDKGEDAGEEETEDGDAKDDERVKNNAEDRGEAEVGNGVSYVGNTSSDICDIGLEGS